MITLTEVFNDLANGELQNHPRIEFDSAEEFPYVPPKAYSQLISHINLGLRDLYSEFLLSAKEIYIDLHEEIETYKLSYQYAQSNADSAADPKYIADTVENPFDDDVLKIEEVYDEGGNLLRLNDFTVDDSLYTPSYNTIQVPWPNNYNTIAVQYRAGHKKIQFTPLMDTDAVKINLPLPLYEALQLFVASRMYSGMNTEQGNTGNMYYNKYLAKVDDVRRRGLFIQAETENWRFDHRGWI